RGLSGRDFANEAAEASRTFQPTRRGPSLTRTSQDPRFASSPGLQGGGPDATADTTIIGGCCGATTAPLSSCAPPPPPPPPPHPSPPRIHSGDGTNIAAPCAAAARGPRGTRTTNSKRCPCDDPLGKAGFEGGARGAPHGGGAGGGVEAAGERVGCERCGCDGERVRALQTMVREQALQLAALRLQQAYRGRVQAAELQRVRHARCRLTSVRLEEFLARRGEREEHNRRAEDQDASSSPRPPQLNPPLPGLSKKGAAAAADLNVDLERRLDRFQEDARVLVGVAKQHNRQSSSS
ncbi:unnamed protein product, partial [Ectocarpus fasciculatus]